MVLSQRNIRRLNQLLQRRPALSITLLNRMIKIATPRLRVLLGGLLNSWHRDGSGVPLYDETLHDEWIRYRLHLRRRVDSEYTYQLPLSAGDVVKSLRVRLSHSQKTPELEIHDDGDNGLSDEERVRREYMRQINEGPRGFCDTFVRVHSGINLQLELQNDSYELLFVGERCWPMLGVLRIQRLTLNADAHIKWDVRGGKILVSFRKDDLFDVSAEYTLRVLSCGVKLPDWLESRIVPRLLHWWAMSCTADDPLEIDLSGEDEELENLIERDGDYKELDEDSHWEREASIDRGAQKASTRLASRQHSLDKLPPGHPPQSPHTQPSNGQQSSQYRQALKEKAKQNRNQGLGLQKPASSAEAARRKRSTYADL
tara:strand:- start:1902 stop:3014 length:1113 start_codon:yes stop_codon:yes gene_type:complete